MNKKLLRIIIISLLVITTAFSCSEKKENRGGLIIKDDLGREIIIKSSPKRVMALSSSLTEILFLICPDSEIVGRTQNCNYPVKALAKPIVNNYPIDFEKLLLLNPDLIFAKDGIISIEEAAKIQEMGIPLYFQHYENLEDVFSGIEKLGGVLNKKERANFVADSLRKEVLKISTTLNNNKRRPKVLIAISLNQIFVFGKDSYVSDIIAAGGGENAVDEIFNNPFPQITTEYIIDINPDIIVTLGEEDKELLITLYPELKNINAVKNSKIFSISENLISRPGPRIVDATRYLNKIISSYED